MNDPGSGGNGVDGAAEASGVGDWVLQMSPVIAAVLTLGIAFVNWRNTVAAGKNGLKDLLSQSIQQNADLAKSISSKLDTTLEALVRGKSQ